ncbi:MAG: peptidase U62, partial [Cyanobacteria bacterium]|nr:peptidase U62 [Cyanobacteriota bacterium]
LVKRIEELAKSLDDLRDAPPADSYVGPAILSGRAASVFFHETFGHRIEAVHEKSEGEAKTFAQKVGTLVMPSFITVIDDPTAVRAHGTSLNGHYKFDDEAVPGQAVTLAKNGVLTGFLMGRTPLQGFEKSNGHGRCAAGWNPTARQSNLFVHTAKNKQHSPEELRALLIKEAKRQKKEYGLYFEEIAGGVTWTDQRAQQAFNIYPKRVYKVFVDGRKDELIRGADIVGTPLTALEKIIASGTEYGVFNGSCGRDSGHVPVSGVAPSLLVQSIEVKRTRKTFQKPPILPDPIGRSDAQPNGGGQ